MRPQVMMVLSRLFCVMLLALLIACAKPPIEILIPQTELVPLVVPDDLLSCSAQPGAPLLDTQRDVALYFIGVAEAGADCRSKLARVRVLNEQHKELEE